MDHPDDMDGAADRGEATVSNNTEKTIISGVTMQQQQEQEQGTILPRTGTETKRITASRKKNGHTITGSKRKKKKKNNNINSRIGGSKQVVVSSTAPVEEECGDGDDENDDNSSNNNADDDDDDDDGENSEIDDDDNTPYQMPYNLHSDLLSISSSQVSSVAAIATTTTTTATNNDRIRVGNNNNNNNNNNTNKNERRSNNHENNSNMNNHESDDASNDSSHNRYFLSEPSVSETEESTSNRRVIEAPHKYPTNHRFDSSISPSIGHRPRYSSRSNDNTARSSNNIDATISYSNTEANIRRLQFRRLRSGAEEDVEEDTTRLTTTTAAAAAEEVAARARSSSTMERRGQQSHQQPIRNVLVHSSPVMSPSGNTSLSSWESNTANDRNHPGPTPHGNHVYVHFESPHMKRNVNKNNNDNNNTNSTIENQQYQYRSQQQPPVSMAQTILNQYGPNSQQQQTESLSAQLHQQQQQQEQLSHQPRRLRQNNEQHNILLYGQQVQSTITTPPPLPQHRTNANTTDHSSYSSQSVDKTSSKGRKKKNGRRKNIAYSIMSLFKPKTTTSNATTTITDTELCHPKQQYDDVEGNNEEEEEEEEQDDGDEEECGPNNNNDDINNDSVNMTFSDTEVGNDEVDDEENNNGLFHMYPSNSNTNRIMDEDFVDVTNTSGDDVFLLSSSLDTKHHHSGLADDEGSSSIRRHQEHHNNNVLRSNNGDNSILDTNTKVTTSSRTTISSVPASEMPFSSNEGPTFARIPRTNSGRLKRIDFRSSSSSQQIQQPQQLQPVWNQNHHHHHQQQQLYLNPNYQQHQHAQQMYLQHPYYQQQQQQEEKQQHQQQQHSMVHPDYGGYTAWLQHMRDLNSSALLSIGTYNHGSGHLSQQQNEVVAYVNDDEADNVEDQQLSCHNRDEYEDDDNNDSGCRNDDNSDDYDSEEDDEDELDESDEEQPITVQQNRLLFQSVDTLTDLSEIENKFHDKSFRGQNQHVMRHHNVSHRESIFANIDKRTAEKLPRASFLTNITTDDPEKRFRTYICPNCKTEQRMFFCADDAVSTGDIPGAYLAVYFSLYVVSSLFIFGIEEGWKPIDCIYFAAITLTTTGLGDYVPTTDANKIICSVFIYFGVACIGLLLGSYIAGMLDERAVAARRQRQIGSCPVCARIKTIKENADTRISAKYAASERNHTVATTPFISLSARQEDRKIPMFYSERNVNESPNRTSGGGVIYAQASHQQDQYSAIPKRRKSSLSQRESTADSSCSGSEHAQVDTDAVPTTPGIKINNDTSQTSSSDTSDSPVQLATSLGSQVTEQILRRQCNTRHYSIDIKDRAKITKSSPSFERVAHTKSKTTSLNATNRSNHQQDSSWSNIVSNSLSWPKMPNTPPTITESKPYYGEHPLSAPTAAKKSVKSLFEETQQSTDADSSEDTSLADEYNFYGDEESSSGDSSTSSTSTLYLADDRKVRLQTAKYIFLTLRTALVNSLVIIAVGCLGFWLIEGFSLVDSWYFTTVLLTTVGYGDITPVTHGGKLFATVYLLVAGTILLNNMSTISMIPLELRRLRIERAVLTQFGDQLDDEALRELATGPLIQRLHLSANRADGLNECTREMFALAMLVRLGKVNEDDIRQTFASFRRLDVNNDGVLNSRSIIAGMIKKTQRQHRMQKNTMTARSSMTTQPPLIESPLRPQQPTVLLNALNQQQPHHFQQPQLNSLGRYWYGNQVPYQSYSNAVPSFPSLRSTSVPADSGRRPSFDHETSALLQHQHFRSVSNNSL